MGKRAVTELERKHLVETDRRIAECKNYIAKQAAQIAYEVTPQRQPGQVSSGLAVRGLVPIGTYEL